MTASAIRAGVRVPAAHSAHPRTANESGEACKAPYSNAEITGAHARADYPEPGSPVGSL